MVAWVPGTQGSQRRNMKQLISRWGKSIDKDNILKEYPRPKLVRDSYYNINGHFEYAITKSKAVDIYTGKILVPFSPETYLSGVSKVVKPDDFLHYRKKFTLPDGFIKDRVILHFGAVDQECEVYLNGIKVGENKGGYLPFNFDVSSEILKDENILTLCLTDKTEQSPHGRGKQRLYKKGKMSSIFYTPSSGIWKTVWLESVSDKYITDVKIRPYYDTAEVGFNISTNGYPGKAQMQIYFQGRPLQQEEVDTDVFVKIKLKELKAWAPNEPNLYDVELVYGDDKIKTYFGMRKFSIEKDNKRILRFLLNNKPFFFNGVLDQGYWPESLLTAPSDEALKYDIIKLKKLGYNTIRKHVKIEPERFYFHCDRLGMIVWQDMPNGGGDYNMLFVAYLPSVFKSFGRIIKDSHYSLFKRKDEEGRRQYYKELEGMIDMLYNYPSIAVWVPFNEGWGQFDAKKASGLIRNLDNTRLICEASGWFDQKDGDIYSIHNYWYKLKVKPQKDRVVALSEYGGYALPVEGHMAFDNAFGYRYYKSSKELTDHYKKLWEDQIYPNIEKGLCSAIYTQTSDIEQEINGLMTYDREVDKMDGEVIKELNTKLYEMFNAIIGN